MAEAGSETDERMSEIENNNDSEYDPEEKQETQPKTLENQGGKWKHYYDNKHFKKDWLEMFPWVEEDPDDPKFAICRACNKKIKAHKGILETHQKTKRHLKNLSGSDDIDDDDEEETETTAPRKSARIADPKYNQSHSMHNMSNIGMEQMMTEDQFSFFTESPMDAAHQAVTNLIDKLVERYHEGRLENLKAQNEAMLQLNVERANLIRAENQRKLERRVQQEECNKQILETTMSYLQQQHEVKMSAMESERDAKLKAVEQQLVFARKEYEKKVKLLDQQLSSIK